MSGTHSRAVSAKPGSQLGHLVSLDDGSIALWRRAGPVRCELPGVHHSGLGEIVERVGDRRVVASGMLHRNAQGDLLKLVVDDISVIPQDAELPTAQDVRHPSKGLARRHLRLYEEPN